MLNIPTIEVTSNVIGDALTCPLSWRKFPETIPVIDDVLSRGIVAPGRPAKELNAGGFVTAQDGEWHASTVRNLCAGM